MEDFQALSCASRATLSGENPYAVQPIASCETQPEPLGLEYRTRGELTPAPYPGYVFVLLSPLTLMPYVAACAAWIAILVAAAIAALALLARLTAARFEGLTALFALSLVFASIPIGAAPPLGLLALVVAAWAARVENRWAFALGLTGLAILPHVALPAFVAAFIFLPQLRWTVAAVGALLAFLDLVAGGPAIASTYFRDVLPQHTLAEVAYVMQFSLTWMARALGATLRGSIAAGDASYIVFAAAGVWAAGRLKKKCADPAFVVFVPAAFAVCGGAFIHFTDSILAFPAAVLLFQRSSTAPRNALAAGMLLAAFPWLWLAQEWFAFAFAAAAVAAALWLFSFPLRTALALGAVPPLLCLALVFLLLHYGPQMNDALAAPPSYFTAAEAAWASQLRNGLSSGGVFWFAGKLPVWLGLWIVAGCALLRAGGDDESNARIPAS